MHDLVPVEQHVPITDAGVGLDNLDPRQFQQVFGGDQHLDLSEQAGAEG